MEGVYVYIALIVISLLLMLIIFCRCSLVEYIAGYIGAALFCRLINPTCPSLLMLTDRPNTAWCTVGLARTCCVSLCLVAELVDDHLRQLGLEIFILLIFWQRKLSPRSESFHINVSLFVNHSWRMIAIMMCNCIQFLCLIWSYLLILYLRNEVASFLVWVWWIIYLAMFEFEFRIFR
jgi:hypothetical protein